MKPKPKFKVEDKLIHKDFDARITHAFFHTKEEKLIPYPETDWHYQIKLSRELWRVAGRGIIQLNKTISETTILKEIFQGIDEKVD